MGAPGVGSRGDLITFSLLTTKTRFLSNLVNYSVTIGSRNFWSKPRSTTQLGPYLSDKQEVPEFSLHGHVQWRIYLITIFSLISKQDSESSSISYTLRPYLIDDLEVSRNFATRPIYNRVAIFDYLLDPKHLWSTTLGGLAWWTSAEGIHRNFWDTANPCHNAAAMTYKERVIRSRYVKVRSGDKIYRYGEAEFSLSRTADSQPTCIDTQNVGIYITSVCLYILWTLYVHFIVT